MLCLFIIGWRRGNAALKLPESSCSEKIPSITVVIACRNEERHISKLLSSLVQQTLSPTQIICVDDHSTDNTHSEISKFSNQHQHITLLDAASEGKKAALAQAIQSADSELILCTDADCVAPPTWVQEVVEAYINTPFDLLILPVQMLNNASFFGRLQSLEFSTLIASGASMAQLNRAIMCNGANLAFRKDAWQNSKSELHNELLSGDDVFLLHALKKRGAHIRFLQTTRAMISTSASENIATFVRQRARWASKAGAYTDLDTIFVALNVFTINCWLLILEISSFCLPHVALILLVVFCFKWMLDTVFLFQTKNFFKHKNIILSSFVLSLIYPFYVLISVLKGFFSTKYKRENQNNF